MLRRLGLLAGMIFSILIVSSMSLAQDVSVFNRKQGTIDQKYGISINGGGSTYLMGDVNDYRVPDPDHTQFGNSEKAEMGFNFGLALLYRSHEKFRWSIGYTYFGADRVYSSWYTDQGQLVEYEQKVSGGEIFLVGSYLVNVSDALSFHFGAGPTICSATLNRSFPYFSNSTELNFSGADGRALGFKGVVGVELMLSKSFALNLDGGFRLANVGELRYGELSETTLPGDLPVVKDYGENNMSVDFTGGFVDLGFRLYFEPATKFWKL